MADVFISYSQKDREVAKALADRLTAKGLSVWWDTELVGGDDYRKAILEQLRAATVVTALWSPNAASSRYVTDEAERAAAASKLISILLPDFSANDLPLGFGPIQSVKLDNEDGLARALQRKGLVYSTPVAIATRPHPIPSVANVDVQDEKSQEKEAWSFVLARRDAKLVEDFQRKFPNSPYLLEARFRKGLISKSNKLALFLVPIFLVLNPLAFWAISTYGPKMELLEAIFKSVMLSVAISIALYGITSVLFGDPDRMLDAQEKEHKPKP